MKYHYVSIRMTKIKKTISSIDKDVIQIEMSDITSGNVK